MNSLSTGLEITVNDIAGIHFARESHRDTGLQCFGSCEEVHSPENKPFQLSLRLMNMLTNIWIMWHNVP